MLKLVGYDLELKNIVNEEIIDDKKLYFVSNSNEKKYIPNFLIDRNENNIDKINICNGLKLVGDFLEKNVLKPNNLNYPISRSEFINLFK